MKPAEILEIPDGLRPVRQAPSDNAPVRALVEKCCRVLIAAEAELNELDAKSGDGDTGSTLAAASKALTAGLDRLPLAVPADLFRAVGQELSESMGGSSGVLMAIFFAAAGDASAGGSGISQSLAAGLERIKQVGGAKAGDRTMIDALEPALAALDSGLERAAAEARRGADATASITRAKAGRASYLAEASLAGHNDPGAEAVAVLFEKLAGN